ncbi:MAG TPA: GerMN domain-containing protein [Thermoanaerobaculia bacterium]|nr:GerMN domain-containing protein [Thermoanaerobaculia bacterium]
MSRIVAKVVIGLALLLVVAGLAWWLLQGQGSRPGQASVPGEVAGPAAEQVRIPVDLYFPAGDGLRGERREIQASRAPKDRIRGVVLALLAGPQSAGLARPLPQGVELGGVGLTADGTAYVDLRWADHDEPPSGGSTAETQMVYSVVNSVTQNVPQATRVTLLWNGTQRLTFSGHLDTSRPLLPDPALILR